MVTGHRMMRHTCMVRERECAREGKGKVVLQEEATCT